MQGDGDEGNARNAPATQHNKHRHRRSPRAAHNTGCTMGERQKAVEQAVSSCTTDTAHDNLGIPVKKPHQKRSKDKDQNADHFRYAHRTKETETGAFFSTLDLTRAEILTDEGRQRHSKTGDRQKAEPFDFGIDALTGDRYFAKGIDIGLNNNVLQNR